MGGLAKQLGFSLDTPWRALPERATSALLKGEGYEVHVTYKNRWGRERSYTSGFEGVLPRGMPIAQCFPVPRTRLDLMQEALDPQAYDALAGELLGGPGVYRRQFRSGPGGEVPHERAGLQPEPPDHG